MKIISVLLKDLGFKRVVGILDGNRVDLLRDLRREFPDYQFHSIPADDVRTKDLVPAKPQIQGLLDGSGVLVEKYKRELSKIFNETNQYLTAR